MENLLSTADLQTYAPDLDLSSFNATTISGLISRASQMVIRYCNLDGFVNTVVTAESDRARIGSTGDLVISFRRRPVAQGNVTAVRLKTTGVNQSLTLQSGGADIYFIPKPGTYMVYPSNYLISFGRGLLPMRGANLFYEVDYSGGYSTIPYDIQEATALFVRDILSKKYNPSGADQFSQGSMSMTFRDNKDIGVGRFAKQARDLLNEGGYQRMVTQ